MQRIAVNTRSMSKPLTGVQRYTGELLSRWNGYAEPITPAQPMNGIRGHVWEQFVLPARVGHRLLFSPCNSGPLEIRNQVVTIHDMVYFDHPETLNRRFAAWLRFLLPQLVRKVQRIITVSGFVKERVVEVLRVPAEKVTVIANGVAPRFCPEAANNNEQARIQLGIPTPHYVLALGSIEPRKNLQRLLHAWERVAEATPQDIWLVVAGGQGNSAIFKSEEFSALPARVHMTGHVADEILPSLVAGALALAYPSIYEGFGLPALEAMASGVPVLAGDCAALREVIGNAGLLVNPLDLREMEEGLVRITQDNTLRSQLRVHGLQRAGRFSWEKSAQATWAVLQEVASSS